MVSRTVSWMLARCGEGVSLVDERGDVRSVTAVIQPMKRHGDSQTAPTPIGTMDEVRYLYLGMAHQPITVAERVLWRTHNYAVQSAHPIYVGSEISHWWAVLVPEEVTQ